MEEKKLFSVRKEFINRVSTSVLKDLLDVLLQERVINSGEMEDIQAMPRTEKASALIDMVLRKGQLACKILIDAFCKQDPFLSEWLQLKTQR
uniref:CARD domain-containing protein n=1 Tax=Stegastes partitus TaxID=144197 RepID=A0A3B5A866_9TELE